MSEKNLKQTEEDMSSQEETAPEGKRIYSSPVLNAAPSKLFPPESCACLDCPNATWMALADQTEKTGSLQCYCQMTRSVTSETGSESYYVMCDGTMLPQDEG